MGGAVFHIRQLVSARVVREDLNGVELKSLVVAEGPLSQPAGGASLTVKLLAGHF